MTPLTRLHDAEVGARIPKKVPTRHIGRAVKPFTGYHWSKQGRDLSAVVRGPTVWGRRSTINVETVWANSLLRFTLASIDVWDLKSAIRTCRDVLKQNSVLPNSYRHPATRISLEINQKSFNLKTSYDSDWELLIHQKRLQLENILRFWLRIIDTPKKRQDI